jgi:hypothetical protein
MTTCAQPDCPLPAEPDFPSCVLHSRRENKAASDLLPAFAALHAAGIIRVKHLYLVGADLTGVSLTLKNLQHSDLRGATLRNARLVKVGFDFSTLDGADFESAILEKVDLRRVVSMRCCRWYETIFDGVKVPGIEHVGVETPYDAAGPQASVAKARYVFRHFKELYKGAGDNEAAGLYYEREMDTKRSDGKALERLWWWVLWATCGYGERPGRTAGLFFAIIAVFAVAYLQCDVQTPQGPLQGFANALYYSVITFTSLGYGDILPVSAVARVLSMMEALIGVFMISLFVFVFCRRMER